MFYDCSTASPCTAVASLCLTPAKEITHVSTAESRTNQSPEESPVGPDLRHQTRQICLPAETDFQTKHLGSLLALIINISGLSHLSQGPRYVCINPSWPELLSPSCFIIPVFFSLVALSYLETRIFSIAVVFWSNNHKTRWS